MAYEDWLRHTWDHPHIDLDLTSVVTVDGELAAFSLAATDGLGRYASAMTGTRRAFRGRGLARLAKAASLHRARDHGCTEAPRLPAVRRGVAVRTGGGAGLRPSGDGTSGRGGPAHRRSAAAGSGSAHRT
ncbi:hypothetical protein [Streptomyces sp. NPDC058989]|uniref:hypothetical protein n=1 Tax=Streptomyces sp. NPDC058989 TaxID=3346686 RepID=UPI0036950186